MATAQDTATVRKSQCKIAFSTCRIDSDISFLFSVDGSVYVWGSNADGQLGLGDSVTIVDTPMRIDIPHTIAYISCGYYHTALVTGKISLKFFKHIVLFE